MRIVIVGAHGQVARLLTRRLADDHDVLGAVRDADQLDDVRADGARPLVLDLEQDGIGAWAAALQGVDAVVFAAGAGPGSGIPRKRTVDLEGALLTADAADAAGVAHLVVVSAMGMDRAPEVDWDALDEWDDDEVFAVYLAAKRDAEHGVHERDVPHTIVRPGRLTDDEPSGRVTAEASVERGEVPRGDVAAVLAAVLEHGPVEGGRTFELVGGDTPVADAVAAVMET